MLSIKMQKKTSEKFQSYPENFHNNPVRFAKVFENKYTFWASLTGKM